MPAASEFIFDFIPHLTERIFIKTVNTGSNECNTVNIAGTCQHISHKTGSLFLATDCCVIAASAIVFGDIDLALYAAIATIVSSFCLDLVLYGRDEAKLVYLITDHEKAIAHRLLQELEIGVTYLQGQGAYTRDSKQVIFCAMQKRLLPRVQEIAMEEDPCVFLIVTSASEIFGEGFKDISAPRL